MVALTCPFVLVCPQNLKEAALKKTEKLGLKKVTLRDLDEPTLESVAAASGHTCATCFFTQCLTCHCPPATGAK
jgi:hypothetical protein